ncbi:MAG TPA: signal peptidase II [Tepidisphaeraceae bacterium]|jgi:signal peptidase II
MNHRLRDTLVSPAAVSRFLLVAAGGVALDLYTKWLAFHKLLIRLDRVDTAYLATSQSYDFIPGWLRFEVTVNQGAVFGIGQGQRLLFLLVSAAAVAFLIYLFLSSRPRQWYYQVVLGMLLAGVVGNVYDRMLFGYVRDMIHALPGWPNPLRGMFPNWQYVFPWIFNVADSLLCVGVTLMLVYTMLMPSRDDQREGEKPVQAQSGQPQSQQV